VGVEDDVSPSAGMLSKQTADRQLIHWMNEVKEELSHTRCDGEGGGYRRRDEKIWRLGMLC
jgi:hypothetical protein